MFSPTQLPEARERARAMADEHTAHRNRYIMDTDPGFWKQAAGWLWTLLAIPLGALWRKVDGAVSKEELRDAIHAAQKASDEARETMRILFANAESDRMQNNTRFAGVQDSIHRIHVDLLNRLTKGGNGG